MGDFNPFDITSWFGGTKSKAPKDRNLGDEYRSVVDAQLGVAPDVLAGEQSLQPQYTALALKNLYSTFTGTDGQPGATQLFSELDPSGARLSQALTDTATSELGLGATLDPELQRLYEQSTRAGQAARGLGYGPADALQEGRTLTELGQKLRSDRRTFATQAAGLNLNRLNSLVNFAQPAATAGPRIINPESAYASALFNQNYAGKLQTNLGNAQNATQLWSGLFSAI